MEGHAPALWPVSVSGSRTIVLYRESAALHGEGAGSVPTGFLRPNRVFLSSNFAATRKCFKSLSLREKEAFSCPASTPTAMAARQAVGPAVSGSPPVSHFRFFSLRFCHQARRKRFRSGVPAADHCTSFVVFKAPTPLNHPTSVNQHHQRPSVAIFFS